MRIRDREIGEKTPCYIVAEVGANHNGSYHNAEELLFSANWAGAEAFKIQLYRADGIYSKQSAPDEWQTIWMNEVPYDWLPRLAERCYDLNMDFVASVFCRETLEAATPHVDALKVASFEATDLDFVAEVVRKGKPTIISLGQCGASDYYNLRNCVRENWPGKEEPNVAYLACTSSYPTQFHDLPFALLRQHQRSARDGALWGISDHSGMDYALDGFPAAVAVALGARIVEVHLRIARSEAGPDVAHSLMPATFKAMVDYVRALEYALGVPDPWNPMGARPNMKYRRSVHAKIPIARGEPFGLHNLVVLRPNDGAPPSALVGLLGKVAEKDYEAGEPVKEAHAA